MTRTCLGFAITTFLTCGAITAATEACVAGRFDDDHVLHRKLLCESLEKRPAHVDAPQSPRLSQQGGGGEHGRRRTIFETEDGRMIVGHAVIHDRRRG
jgi:hypothetical protein